MDDLIRKEDAIEIFSQLWDCIDEIADKEEWEDVCKTTANELPPAQHWIPCSERLPNIGEDVLFSVADLYTAEGCLRDDGDYCQFRWNSIIPKDRVTAWMPLPEAYKEVEE